MAIEGRTAPKFVHHRRVCTDLRKPDNTSFAISTNAWTIEIKQPSGGLAKIPVGNPMTPDPKRICPYSQVCMIGLGKSTAWTTTGRLLIQPINHFPS